MTWTFDDVLAKIRSEARNKRDLGDRFEKITRDFLVTATEYKTLYSKVWLWKDWEHKYEISDGRDIGVDLVAEEVDGGLCAIQCKCYDDEGNLSYKAISTFFSTAEMIEKTLKRKVNTILVYTGDRTTAIADKAIRINHCHVIDQNTFRNSSVIWDKFPKMVVKKPHELKPHQERAFNDVVTKMDSEDRGKMIMACGTGKTFTALRIAEECVGEGGTVLYLVPSISLVAQTIREWSQNAKISHRYAAVCSDRTVGSEEDGDISEIAVPPTTDVKILRSRFSRIPKNAMGVVFSTYHSIDVARRAIDGHFDLVICDEAHRTTGAKRDLTKDPSHFTRVHDAEYVKAKKRLYMTATPRVYGEAVIKDKANVVHSMDDESVFGKCWHLYSFGNAVDERQLADFKVRVPVLKEEDIGRYVDESINDEDRTAGTIDERVLLAAVWHALNYDNKVRQPLLKRVISFSNKIQASKQFAGTYDGKAPTQDEEQYKKERTAREDEDRIEQDRSFENTVDEYERKSDSKTGNCVTVRHIDGGMRSSIRGAKLRWLRNDSDDPNECRILSNARCLSEGVDVPALDAVIFLQPRKSQIDVVQSVGRVMRKAEGKNYGYVILPVIIPAGMTWEQSLHDNRPWRAVWQVINALRSHNPKLTDDINKAKLNVTSDKGSSDPPRNVEIIWMGSHRDANTEHEMFGQLMTTMVKKIGTRSYFDDQARDLGRKAKEIRGHIYESYERGNSKTVQTVGKLSGDLRTILNDTMDEKSAISILAQHHALKRIFDALFPSEFRSSNPVANALDTAVRDIGMNKELEVFEPFYEEIQKKVSGLRMKARQNYIMKVYENFLLGFDKKAQEANGVVYTPSEIIDFIIRSVGDVLESEFGKGYGDKDVKILDPFTGTGSFVTGLLERMSELGLPADTIRKKYREDIWANEISLLAYYTAAVNIGSTFADTLKTKVHTEFKNLNFTDTLNHDPRFRLDVRHRQKDIRIDGKLEEVNKNIRRHNMEPLTIIIGNPPYSAGQSNFNDQNQNVKYKNVDDRIEDTYIKNTKKINPKIVNIKGLYDSYIRSIRWASDRIGNSGIIGFVTSGSFIKTDTAVGFRACIQKEFTDMWVFDLRGNQRTKGEMSKKEGGKIFGSGSRAPVAITILVKNPKKVKKDGTIHGTIHYRDIGDYLSQKEKLDTITQLGSINGIPDWEKITPDRHHDWLDQRTDEFSKYLPMGSNDASKINTMFRTYSNGIITARDAWIYNSSEKALANNMRRHIDYCNEHLGVKPDIIDSKRGKWDGELEDRLKKLGKQTFDKKKIRIASYRPFLKQYLYFDGVFNRRQSIAPIAFPKNESENLLICVPHKFMGDFSIFVTNTVPDAGLVQTIQCFPLYVYRNGKKLDNITDHTVNEYRNHYNDPNITKEQVFEYVYGLLHHPKYQKKYKNNLSRERPRIPMAPNFNIFKEAGKSLIKLHLNYETGTKYNLDKPKFSPNKLTKVSFGLKKIKKSHKSKTVVDKSVICGDGKNVIFDNLPDIQYRINGNTPMDWFVDRYNRKLDKDSGIVNYPLAEMTGREVIDLICRLVHVGVESDRIIESISKEEFEPENWEPKKTGLDRYASSG